MKLLPRLSTVTTALLATSFAAAGTAYYFFVDARDLRRMLRKSHENTERMLRTFGQLRRVLDLPPVAQEKAIVSEVDRLARLCGRRS